MPIRRAASRVEGVSSGMMAAALSRRGWGRPENVSAPAPDPLGSGAAQREWSCHAETQWTPR